MQPLLEIMSSNSDGMWRSPVAQRSGGPEVASSNLVIPTRLRKSARLSFFCACCTKNDLVKFLSPVGRTICFAFVLISRWSNDLLRFCTYLPLVERSASLLYLSPVGRTICFAVYKSCHPDNFSSLTHLYLFWRWYLIVRYLHRVLQVILLLRPA